MTRLIDVDVIQDEPDAPYFDPFDEASRQIALAIGSHQQVTVTELETLKQWCIQNIQEKEQL